MHIVPVYIHTCAHMHMHTHITKGQWFMSYKKNCMSIVSQELEIIMFSYDECGQKIE